MKVVVAASLGLLVAGCTGLNAVSPDVDYQVVVQAVVNDCDSPPGRNTSPSTAMEIGFAKVQAACEVFFDEATRAQQNNLMASRGLDAALLAATAIINPTTSIAQAAKAITITTAGVLLGKSILENNSNIYTFSKNLYKVREHVNSSMNTYIVSSREHPPTNYCMAYTYIQKFATYCSLSALQSFYDQQMALPSDATPVVPGGQGKGGARSARRMLGRALGDPVAVTNGPPAISYIVTNRPR